MLARRMASRPRHKPQDHGREPHEWTSRCRHQVHHRDDHHHGPPSQQMQETCRAPPCSSRRLQRPKVTSIRQGLPVHEPEAGSAVRTRGSWARFVRAQGAPGPRRVSTSTTRGRWRHLQDGPQRASNETDQGQAYELSAKEHREHQSNHGTGAERRDRWLWETGVEALRTTAMRFGVQGTNRPRNRDDEGDPHVGVREGDRWCMQCGPD